MTKEKLDPEMQKFQSDLLPSVRTLQEWKQGRREPTGSARTLLRMAVHSPEALLSLP